jgi:hypothetical protein
MKASTRARHSAQAAFPNVNKPVDPADATYIICLATAWGGEALDFGRAELDRYNRGPDAYAGRHFGFASGADYCEWVELRGGPLCSERTRAGKLCRNPIGRGGRRPEDWLRLHRSGPCAIHSKTEARS